MKIQIYVKNEPLEPGCQVLVIREDASVQMTVPAMLEFRESGPEVLPVKPGENLTVKAALLAAEAIGKTGGGDREPVQVACADKAVLDAVCSVEYRAADGSMVKCVPAKAGAAPKSAARPAPKAKSAGSRQAQAPARKQEPKPAPAGPDKPAPAGPDKPAPAPAAAPEPDPMADPAFVKPDGEMELGGTPAAPGPVPASAGDAGARAVNEGASKIMKLLKDRGVPSGQIPGVLEAVRAAGSISELEPLVKDRLARDGASGDKSPAETAALVLPVFSAVKSILDGIDAANGNG